MDDWEFAKEIIAEYDLIGRTKEVLISPVHGIENLAEIAEAVATSGLKVRLNLQLHKYIWGAKPEGFSIRCVLRGLCVKFLTQ